MKLKEIKYSSHFLKQLKKLPPQEKENLIKLENIFREDCFHPKLKTHKLTGKLEGFWSFSISFKNRILFKFDGDCSVVLIDVGNHSIYKP